MLKEGYKAPLFSVKSDEGKEISLRELRGTTIVLYFYPRDLTPGCTLEACDFRDCFTALRKKKVLVLGVSRDTVEKHGKFKAKYELPFPLLADIDGKICETYGVWKEKNLYGKKYMGIERSTFLINPQGKILKIFTKVKVKGHVKEVCNFL